MIPTKISDTPELVRIYSSPFSGSRRLISALPLRPHPSASSGDHGDEPHRDVGPRVDPPWQNRSKDRVPAPRRENQAEDLPNPHQQNDARRRRQSRSELLFSVFPTISFLLPLLLLLLLLLLLFLLFLYPSFSSLNYLNFIFVSAHAQI